MCARYANNNFNILSKQHPKGITKKKKITNELFPLYLDVSPESKNN